MDQTRVCNLCILKVKPLQLREPSEMDQPCVRDVGFSEMEIFKLLQVTEMRYPAI